MKTSPVIPIKWYGCADCVFRQLTQTARPLKGYVPSVTHAKRAFLTPSCDSTEEHKKCQPLNKHGAMQEQKPATT